MWQTKYASAVPKKFGVGIEFLFVKLRLFTLWVSVVRETNKQITICNYYSLHTCNMEHSVFAKH